MYSLKKNKFLRKNVLIFITFVIFSGITIYYINVENVSNIQPFIMHLDAVHSNISCHYVDSGDALPSAEERNFSPRPNSIFFHETSCRGGINSRQACAIESASRAHPERQVYVLFSGPVSDVVYQRSCIAKLRHFPNVRFARVHITDYAKKTPLEAMVVSEPFKESRWRVEHTADVLRFLTLYKWGGVYLDMDIMVVKSLTPLGHNWAAREGLDYVSTAAIALSMDHLGRRLADAVITLVARQQTTPEDRVRDSYGGRHPLAADTYNMDVLEIVIPSFFCKSIRYCRSRLLKNILSILSENIHVAELQRLRYCPATNKCFFNKIYLCEIKTTYRPYAWSYNGPGAITRVLRKMCNTSNLADLSANTCDGLEVYGPTYFYPIHYSRKDEYFKAGDLQNVENAYTHHFWNKLTYDMKIEKDSPYAKMAQKFCPTIFEMYGEEFGS